MEYGLGMATAFSELKVRSQHLPKHFWYNFWVREAAWDMQSGCQHNGISGTIEWIIITNRLSKTRPVHKSRIPLRFWILLELNSCYDTNFKPSVQPALPWLPWVQGLKPLLPPRSATSPGRVLPTFQLPQQHPQACYLPLQPPDFLLDSPPSAQPPSALPTLPTLPPTLSTPPFVRSWASLAWGTVTGPKHRVSWGCENEMARYRKEESHRSRQTGKVCQETRLMWAEWKGEVRAGLTEHLGASWGSKRLNVPRSSSSQHEEGCQGKCMDIHHWERPNESLPWAPEHSVGNRERNCVRNSCSSPRLCDVKQIP